MLMSFVSNDVKKKYTGTRKVTFLVKQNTRMKKDALGDGNEDDTKWLGRMFQVAIVILLLEQLAKWKDEFPFFSAFPFTHWRE